MNNTVTVLAKFEVKEGQMEAFKQAVAELIMETRKEAGCISYVLNETLDNPNEFWLVESWHS